MATDSKMKFANLLLRGCFRAFCLVGAVLLHSGGGMAAIGGSAVTLAAMERSEDADAMLTIVAAFSGEEIAEVKYQPGISSETLEQLAGQSSTRHPTISRYYQQNLGPACSR
ncbi:unnamed protein product [Amoebophrya sp. A25]|nr:unnamed protein product [Amoebophrya sp. A25]|eukprot:GSA25T00001912001.1